MTRRLYARLTLAMAGLLLPLNPAPVRAAVDGDPAIAVPFVSAIAVDGDPADWRGRGFCVNVLRAEGTQQPDDGFLPRYRIGWDDSGLLVLFEVRDRNIAEPTQQSEAPERDCVQLWCAAGAEGARAFGVALSPGIAPKREIPPIYPADPQSTADVQAAAAVRVGARGSADGYTLETLVPWAQLGVTPKDGVEVSFRVLVNSRDRAGQVTRALGHPYANSDDTVRLRLARTPSPAVSALSTSVQVEHHRRILVDLRTCPELVGQRLAIKDGSRTVAACTVARGGDGCGAATATVPLPTHFGRYGWLAIEAKGRRVGQVLPDHDLGLLLPKGLQEANLRFDPYVFRGPEFPPCDFERPELAEDLIGPYTVGVTFYDKDYNLVTSADRPGRYGAVVEVKPRSGGPTVRRYRTLFRTAQPLGWWDTSLDVKVKLPKELGLDPAVVEQEMPDLADALKWGLADACATDWHAPILLAGLYETKPTGAKAPPRANALALDRQWWVGLRRKLYGDDTAYPQPLVAPRPIEGQPATVLHEGTLAEAGMNPDAADRIDKVLQAWAADSDEGFATLVARHGVIVLHKAYGMRDGAPMSLTSKSWMASITKTLSSNLMMMLVDQGLVDLDDPVDKHLPPLRGIKVAKALTIRHLYTHTSGFPENDHWGDEMSDLESVLADYYPYLEVGQRRAYNGVGLAIGSKIVELISGEAIPAFYQHHLLAPLCCENTDVTGAYGDARSVPLDIAKVGQMMLNRGAYANLRFYSEETFAKMLPQPLTKVLGRDDGHTIGIGLYKYDIPGLSNATFGHGSASDAIFLVDLVNDLVIVMTRNTPGRNFGKYYPQFLHAVAEGMGALAKP